MNNCLAQGTSSHEHFGKVDWQVYFILREKYHVQITFALHPCQNLQLQRYKDPDGYVNTLISQYKWYCSHVFREGELLKWQSGCEVNSGKQTIGPWLLYAEKNGMEIVWEIPALEVEIPPLLIVSSEIIKLANHHQIDIWIKNKSQIDADDILLQADFYGENPAADFSGPAQFYFDIPAGPAVKKISYLSENGKIMQLSLCKDNKVILQKKIKIQEPDSPPEANEMNEAVEDEVKTSKGKKLKRKRGYYVTSAKKLEIVINPKGDKQIASVRKINISHPNVSIAEIGNNKDKEFCYTLEFHHSNPLTTRLLITYTVEYENDFVRAQVLSFKLRANFFGLFLMGFLFVMPTVIDLITGVWPEGEWTLELGFCFVGFLAPFLYDFIRSRF